MSVRFRQIAWFLAGLCLVAGALWFPVHWSGLDWGVVKVAGARSGTALEAAADWIRQEKPGPAALVLDFQRLTPAAAKAAPLEKAVADLNRLHPEIAPWGGPAPWLNHLLPSRGEKSVPIFEQIVSREARNRLLSHLQANPNPAVTELLRHRQLNALAYFSPVGSASGQPLEAAILLSAFLLQNNQVPTPLAAELIRSATLANRGEGSRPMEEFYMGLLSLAKRLDWNQLTTFLAPQRSMHDVNQLAAWIRRAEPNLPILYAAVTISGEPNAIVRFLSRDGSVTDLKLALQSGQAGLAEVLKRQKPIHRPDWRERLLAYEPFYSSFQLLSRLTWNLPMVMLILKWIGLAAGVIVSSSALAGLFAERDLPTFSGARLFVGLGLAAAVAVSIEPFLLQHRPILELPLRWDFPQASAALRETIINQIGPIMDKLTLVALLLFLVIQAAIYLLGLRKIGEIRKQPVASHLKLKLLENEETLFDSGLYCGLAGTVLSLVFLAVGVIKPSLMAAYSSTLFGIVFVALLKICHLRPTRRKLILETERNAS